MKNHKFLVFVAVGSTVAVATLYWYATDTSNRVLTPIATLILLPGIVLTGGIHRGPSWAVLFMVSCVIWVAAVWLLELIYARLVR